MILIFTKKETYNSAIRAHRNNATAAGSICFDNHDRHQPCHLELRSIKKATSFSSGFYRFQLFEMLAWLARGLGTLFLQKDSVRWIRFPSDCGWAGYAIGVEAMATNWSSSTSFGNKEVTQVLQRVDTFFSLLQYNLLLSFILLACIIFLTPYK